MDEIKTERTLSLVGGNPNIEKTPHDDNAPNPLSLAYQRSAKDEERALREEQRYYTRLFADDLHIPLAPPVIDALKNALAEEIDFTDPDWHADEEMLEDIYSSFKKSLINLEKFGGEFFADGKIPAHVTAAAILTDIEDLDDAPYHHKKAMRIARHVNEIWNHYGKGYQEAKPEEKVVFLNLLKANMDCVKSIYQNLNANYTPMARRYIYSFAPIAKHLSNDTEFERNILENLEYMREAIEKRLPPTEIYRLDPNAPRHHTIMPSRPSDEPAVSKHRIGPDEEHQLILYSKGKERFAAQWNDVAKASHARLEQEKQGLITKIIEDLKLKTLTPYGKKTLQAILEKDIDFNDPDWQMGIEEYNNVTNGIEETIGFIREYGYAYFKDGIVPPTVYATALAMEYNNSKPELPYAEKKIYRAVDKLQETYAKDFQNAKPQTKIVFLNFLKNEIELDAALYAMDDDENSTYHDELSIKFLNYYTPIARHITPQTAFENELLRRIDEIETMLKVNESPKAARVDMEAARAKHPVRSAVQTEPSTNNDKLAQRHIMPDSQHQHILFEENAP